MVWERPRTGFENVDDDTIIIGAGPPVEYALSICLRLLISAMTTKQIKVIVRKDKKFVHPKTGQWKSHDEQWKDVFSFLARGNREIVKVEDNEDHTVYLIE